MKLVKEYNSNNEDFLELYEDNGSYFLHRGYNNLSDESKNDLYSSVSKIQSYVSHPNLSKIKEVFLKGESLVIVEEVNYGTRLSDYLEKNRKLSLRQGRWILDNLIRALNSMPNSLVHGDIRPENIWIDLNKNFNPVLSSFPVFYPQATDCYSSPEHHIGGQLTLQSDIYSLGALFYKSLTGLNLPNSLEVKSGKSSYQSPRDAAAVEKNWNQFIMRSLEISPSKRFTSIASIMQFFDLKKGDVPQQQQSLKSAESITWKNKLN